MEDTTELIRLANEQLVESKRILGETVNQIRKTADIVVPTLAAHIEQLRTSRMAISREGELSLQALRDVRKFFIESQYEEEMARLERFLAVCERLKELQRDGTLDAISEIVIRLAVKEGR